MMRSGNEAATRACDRRHPLRASKWLAALSTLAALVAAGAMTPAAAQVAYPTKPIHMIIGAAAGSPTDVVARAIATKVGERLHQSIIVDNHPGQGGLAAADEVSKAAADGYVIGLITEETVINAAMKPGFDPQRDLAPVSLVGMTPLVLIVDPASKIMSVRQLIDQVNANPGKHKFAATGNGTTSQLAAELFKSLGDIDMATVMYPDTATARSDVASGRVTAMFDTVPDAYDEIKSGKLRAIAEGGHKRDDSLPRVPTVKQGGLPDFEVRAWYGLVAPPKTSTLVIQVLAEALSKMANKDRDAPSNSIDMRDSSGAPLLQAVCSSPLELGIFIHEEMLYWAPVAKMANIH